MKTSAIRKYSLAKMSLQMEHITKEKLKIFNGEPLLFQERMLLFQQNFEIHFKIH